MRDTDLELQHPPQNIVTTIRVQETMLQCTEDVKDDEREQRIG
jgi:hypothetical protein